MPNKRDATLGGPGLDGYAFNADVYCVYCAHDIIADLEMPRGGWSEDDFQNSEVVPQPIFFGESDTAQHCRDCGEYLYGPEEEEEENDDDE